MTDQERTILNSIPRGEGPPARTAREVPGGTAEYSVRVIGTGAQFDDLAEAWTDLLGRADATVFQTYEWQRTWWKYFGNRRDLYIVLFERHGKPEGIVPLFREWVKLLGIPVARHLKFIGSGLSDYLAPIAQRGCEAAVADALARHLAEHRGGWDVFDLEDLSEGSPYLEPLPSSLEGARLPVYRYQGTVCPAIDLPGSMDELMRSLGSNASYNLKRKKRKLQSNFTSEIELVRDESDDIAGAISDFASIHGERWKSQGHPSAFDDEKHREFHVEVSRGLARRGYLRIYFLKVDGKRVAVNLNFNFRSVIYMYQGNAHGPEDVMKCSPGLLIAAAAIEAGIGEGMRVYDFMRGDETYKYREWNAVDRKNWLIRSSSPTAGGRVRFYFFLSAELFRKVRDRIRREWYDYRRFRIAGKGLTSHLGYLRGKMVTLFGMYIQFLKRHFRRQRRPGGNG